MVKLEILSVPKPTRKAGSMTGYFEVPDSFFEPLPREIIDSFAGEAQSPLEQILFGLEEGQLLAFNALLDGPIECNPGLDRLMRVKTPWNTDM